MGLFFGHGLLSKIYSGRSVIQQRYTRRFCYNQTDIAVNSPVEVEVSDQRHYIELLGVVYSHENFVVCPVFDIVGYFKSKSAVSTPVFAPVFTVDKKVGYAVDAFEI